MYRAGHPENSIRIELASLIKKVNESGVHGHVRTMLYEKRSSFSSIHCNSVGPRA
jgi:hypothetical protein